MTTVFISINIVKKIKTILHSKPHWGHPSINEFVFGYEPISMVKGLHNKKSIPKGRSLVR